MESLNFHDLRDSEVEFYEFPDIRNSSWEQLNFHDFLDSVVEIYEFHDFHYCGME